MTIVGFMAIYVASFMFFLAPVVRDAPRLGLRFLLVGLILIAAGVALATSPAHGPGR